MSSPYFKNSKLSTLSSPRGENTELGALLALPNHLRKLAPLASSLPNTTPKQLKRSPDLSAKLNSKSTKRESPTAPTKSEMAPTSPSSRRKPSSSLPPKSNPSKTTTLTSNSPATPPLLSFPSLSKTRTLFSLDFFSLRE
ncbi:MAG: hypothetical protein K940chlam9_01903 [Chlamydiae bacterium]|nr:hypothetical protein [Chlamydiota bacterium]